MKKIDLDQFLDENAVEITIAGKPYTIRDLSLEDGEALAKEDSDKKAVLAKILGCPIEALEPYGAIGIMKIVTYLNENLLPSTSQQAT